MPRSQSATIGRIAEQWCVEGGPGSADSATDLQLEIVDETTGELLLAVGGRWDRLAADGRGDYVSDADSARVISMHVGQIDAVTFFAWWLDRHLLGDVSPEDMVFDIIASGGRRGGKTAFSMTVAVAYAVACPGSIVWIVCPSEESGFNEPTDYLNSIMPASWYYHLGDPAFIWVLANGSTIQLKSGHTPGLLKQGRADFIVINEGQRIPPQSYDTLSASIVDIGGCIVTAANPPDVGDKGTWVAGLITETERGDRKYARHFFFDPRRNPHIVQAALAALAEKYDEHTFNIQVLGMVLLPPDSVLHAWDRRSNEEPAPDPSLDCTREFTLYHEGRSYDDIVGVDVQNFPWIAAVRMRAYRNPKAPLDMSRARLWGVGEAFVAKGDEVDTCKILRNELLLDPERTLVIMDASCRWQQQKRNENDQRTNYRGKGSMDMFIGEGFRHVVPPDRESDANPNILERVRAANARIGNKAGDRLALVDPRRCPQTAKSIRHWRRSKTTGMPSRTSQHAHGGDAITYILWRFFPRRLEHERIDVQTIKRFAGRDRVKGF